jgi:hypothetical protein
VVSYAIVVVITAAFFTGLYYFEEIQSIVLLRPWDKAAPRAAADEWREAIERNDQQALESLTRPGVAFLTDDGEITAVQLDPQLGAVRIELVTPAIPADDATVEFELGKMQRRATVYLATKADTTVGLVLEPGEGGWLVTEFLTLSSEPPR